LKADRDSIVHGTTRQKEIHKAPSFDWPHCLILVDPPLSHAVITSLAINYRPVVSRLRVVRPCDDHTNAQS